MTTADLAALRAQLAEHEGMRLRPYRCTAGKLTIGIGRNLEDKGITAKEAMLLLDADIDECLTDLRGSFRWFATLDAVRQRALLDLRFNLGPYRFRTFKRMLSALENRDYERAARELVLSAWSTQVQPARARRLVRQLKVGEE